MKSLNDLKSSSEKVFKNWREENPNTPTLCHNFVYVKALTESKNVLTSPDDTTGEQYIGWCVVLAVGPDVSLMYFDEEGRHKQLEGGELVRVPDIKLEPYINVQNPNTNQTVRKRNSDCELYLLADVDNTKQTDIYQDNKTALISPHKIYEIYG